MLWVLDVGIWRFGFRLARHRHLRRHCRPVLIWRTRTKSIPSAIGATGLLEPDLLGPSPGHWLPIDCPVHHLAHPGKPPLRPTSPPLRFADRCRQCSETHFQLRIKHTDPFYFSEHSAEGTWTNTVHVEKIVCAIKMSYTNAYGCLRTAKGLLTPSPTASDWCPYLPTGSADWTFGSPDFGLPRKRLQRPARTTNRSWAARRNPVSSL